MEWYYENGGVIYSQQQLTSSSCTLVEHSASFVNWPEASRIIHLFSHRRHLLLMAHVACVPSSHLTTFCRGDGCDTTSTKRGGSTYRWMTNEDLAQANVCLSSRKVMNYITSSLDGSECVGC